MSVDATRWAWSVEVSSSTKRLVLLALADRAGEDHTCYPSAKRMSKDTNLDRKTILNAINELIADGLVLNTGEKKGTGVRVLKLIGIECRENEVHPKRISDTKTGTSTKNGTDTNSGIPSDTKNGIPSDTNFGIQNLKGNLTRNLTDTSEEKAKKFSMEKSLIEHGGDKELVREWVKIRKVKKATESERALSMFLKQVEKSGQNINTILNLCVVKSWKGFEVDYLRNINIQDYLIHQESGIQIPSEQDSRPVQKAKAVSINYLD